MRFELAVVAVAVMTAACAQPVASTIPTAHVAQPEVVAVDFFGGNNATGACSGTLLAKNVVLTAAHCATSGSKAFVRAPDASGQTAGVKTVRFYDWQPGDTSDHASQHDLALLILDKSIQLDAYPKVWNANADGVTATQAARTASDALSSSTKVGKVAIAKGRPTGNPLMLAVSNASVDAGGPLFGIDADGKTAVVGVMIGRGAKTSSSYAARVADSKVRGWISSIVANPNQAVTPPQANLAAAHFFGDDGDDGGGFDEGDFGDSNFDDSGNGGLDMGDGATPSDDSAPSTATPSQSDGNDTATPSDDTTEPTTTPSESSATTPTSSSDAEKITPSGISTFGNPVSDTQTQPAADAPLTQTFGYPVSDTQFQLTQRENEQRMLDSSFGTSQDAK